MEVPPSKRLHVFDAILGSHLDALVQFLDNSELGPPPPPSLGHLVRLFDLALAGTNFWLKAPSRDKLFRLVMMAVKVRVKKK